MFNIVKKEISWGDKTLELETGKIARQASGAVVAKMGGTVVLCTVVGKKECKEDVDFFPLTVNYIEKFYAAGKFPGGFVKRESKPTERETLISRLIDRPIRPLFPKGYKNETQIICTVKSYDPENAPDIVAIAGASAALAISGVPFLEPIAGVRVGFKDDEFTLNPTKEELEGSSLDLVVAGTESSVLMVESEASELSEEVMLNAVEFAHKNLQPVIEGIKELLKEVAQEKWEVKAKDNSELVEKVKEFVYNDVKIAYEEKEKQLRKDKISEIKEKLLSQLKEEEIQESEVLNIFGSIEKEIVRSKVLDDKTRIDGRKHDDIRDIECEIDLLPKTHGSALFTRGETQAIVTTTLGTPQDEQMVDDLTGVNYENFMLHYTFPPYCVGEVGAMRAPGRREIGHGKLALKAMNALVPSKEEFPYTIRVASEITESNGSSSMATVCGTSLALMASGVPVKRHVSGIAMGLVKEGEKYAVLSDIMGDEDHLGDMDFKVAGTEKGITALQMDIKINGINKEIMEKALNQAEKGRKHILSKMIEAISSKREDLSDNAPRITTITVKKDRIKDIIGTGGKVIREICETSGAKIDIGDDGTVKIASASSESMKKANDMINDIIAEPEVGTTYDGVVVRITDFGAFIRFMGAKEGLLHISDMAEGRVEKVEDVLSLGEELKVKLINIDKSGKIKFSIRDNAKSSKPSPKKKVPSSKTSKKDKPQAMKEVQEKKKKLRFF